MHDALNAMAVSASVKMQPDSAVMDAIPEGEELEELPLAAETAALVVLVLFLVDELQLSASSSSEDDFFFLIELTEQVTRGAVVP